MLISFSKSLQNSNLEKEYKEIQKDCILHSFKKERSVNNFTKTLNVFNKKTGEYTNFDNSYINEINKRSHNNLQKSSTIVKMAIEKDLVPIFITWTLPSKFHPFSSKDLKNRIVFFKNKNFEFKTIYQSIKEGYLLLNQVHRDFYKSVKNINKDLHYISSTEYHKSFIPHSHLLIFVKRELIEDVRKKFDYQIKKHKLLKVDFQIIDNEDFNAEIVSSYIRKYMFKNLILNDDDIKTKSNKLTQSRFFDGYLKFFKIRQFKMNNLNLSLDIYSKVYYSLNREFKEKIIEEITPLKKCLFQFIMENIKVKKRVFNVDINKNVFTQFSLGNSKKIFEVFVETVKSSNTSKIVNFLIYQNGKLIYNKKDYQVYQILNSRKL